MRFQFPCIFCLFIFFAFALQATAEESQLSIGAGAAIRGAYGDWQIRCETSASTKNEQCALVQSVIATDRANVGLLVVAFKTSDQKSQILRIITPLGVLLPSGLWLRIDNENIGATDFVRCVPSGCIAEAKLNDELVKKLKNGKIANFVIFQTPEEGIGVPISLNGFAQGYDQLK